MNELVVEEREQVWKKDGYSGFRNLKLKTTVHVKMYSG